eukprot:g51338.t1
MPLRSPRPATAQELPTACGLALLVLLWASPHQAAYLKPSNTGSYAAFGSSVAISGDTALVGASFRNNCCNQMERRRSIWLQQLLRRSRCGLCFCARRQRALGTKRLPQGQQLRNRSPIRFVSGDLDLEILILIQFDSYLRCPHFQQRCCCMGGGVR